MRRGALVGSLIVMAAAIGIQDGEILTTCAACDTGAPGNPATSPKR